MAKSSLANISLPGLDLPPNSEHSSQTSTAAIIGAQSLTDYTLPDPNAIPAILDDGGAMNQPGDLSSIKLTGPEAEAKTLGDFKMCKICNISLNSKSQADMHYAGKIHQKKLRQIARAESFASDSDAVAATVDNTACSSDDTTTQEKKKTDVFLPHCDICKLTFTGISQVETHLTGAKHAKKLRQLAEKQKMEETQEVVPSEGTMASRVPESYYCKPCDTVCTSQAQLNQHVQGSKHKNVLEGINNASTTRPAASVQSDHTSPSEVVMASYVCSTCNISANSEQQYLQHLGSAKHSNKLRNRDGKDKYRDHPYPKRQSKMGNPDSNFNSQKSNNYSRSSWGNNNWTGNKWQEGSNNQNGSPNSWGRGRGRGRGGQGMSRGGQGMGRGGQGMGRGGQGMGRGGQGMGRGGQGMGRGGQGMGRGGQGMGRVGQGMGRSGQGMGRSGQGMGRSGQGMAKGGQVSSRGGRASNRGWQMSQNQLYDDMQYSSSFDDTQYSSSFDDTETSTNYSHQFPDNASSYSSSTTGYRWGSRTSGSESLQEGAGEKGSGEKGSWQMSLSQSKMESGTDGNWDQTNYQGFAINYVQQSTSTAEQYT